MRKPAVLSGIDDMTAKYQSFQRLLHQFEEGDTFGDEIDQDKVFEIWPRIISNLIQSYTSS